MALWRIFWVRHHAGHPECARERDSFDITTVKHSVKLFHGDFVKHSQVQQEWRWYVYYLVDPRDGSVFYVGKGTGARIDAHEMQASRGVCSRKTMRINEIRDSGLAIGKLLVAQFRCEQAAYDFETDEIERIGLENLTNVLPGGQKAWERRLLARRHKKSKLSPVKYPDWNASAGCVAWIIRNSNGLMGEVDKDCLVDETALGATVGSIIRDSFGGYVETAKTILAYWIKSSGFDDVAREMACYGIKLVRAE